MIIFGVFLLIANMAQTDLGKDLLSQDYILKQLTSSLTYPESDTGKVYWDKIYKEVQKIAGTTNIPINTFNKVWIVPDEAEVYENDNTALITHASLKVLTDEDYLAMGNNTNIVGEGLASSRNKISNNHNGQAQGPVPTQAKQINKIALESFRQTILPEINKDVNTGKNFSKLRQIYNSIILGIWFKKKFQESIYKHYINQGKLKGIDLADKNAKDKIYNLYVQAFKKGIYDYIKTEQGQGPKANSQRPIRRRYHSGGIGNFYFGNAAGSALRIENSSSSLKYSPTDFIGMASSVLIATEYELGTDSAKYSKKQSSSAAKITMHQEKSGIRNEELTKSGASSSPGDEGQAANAYNQIIKNYRHLDETIDFNYVEQYLKLLIEPISTLHELVVNKAVPVNGTKPAAMIEKLTMVQTAYFLTPDSKKKIKEIKEILEAIKTKASISLTEKNEQKLDELLKEGREKLDEYVYYMSKWPNGITLLEHHIGYQVSNGKVKNLSRLLDIENAEDILFLQEVEEHNSKVEWSKNLINEIGNTHQEIIEIKSTSSSISARPSSGIHGGIAMEGAGIGINPAAASSAIKMGDFSNASGIKFQILKIAYFKDVDSILNLP